MQSKLLLRSVSLIMLGFILGVIFSGFEKVVQPESAGSTVRANYSQTNLGGGQVDYLPLATTGRWDIVTFAEGRQVALGRDGEVKVVVIDDESALYVMTYGRSSALWEGRLVDFGADGFVEVADISGGHCENFDH